MGCQQLCTARPKGSSCSLEKCADSALWLLNAVYTRRMLTTSLRLNTILFVSISRHLKLELLTQFPASNDGNIHSHEKIDISNVGLLD